MTGVGGQLHAPAALLPVPTKQNFINWNICIQLTNLANFVLYQHTMRMTKWRNKRLNLLLAADDHIKKLTQK